VTVEIDSTVFSAIVAGVGTVFVTLSGAIAHLWGSLNTERRGRLEDRAAYTEAMLSAARALREEDARTEADLRAKLEAATAPPPSQRSAAPRRKSRQ
jgi:hypothetical protein